MKKLFRCSLAASLLLLSCDEKKDGNENTGSTGTAVVPENCDHCIDANGKKNGHWIWTGKMKNDSAFGSTAKVEEGDYQNDLREGTWSEYYPSGKLKAKGNYVHDKKSGYWKEFAEDGRETGEIVYPSAE
jgi:hypothetical protein